MLFTLIDHTKKCCHFRELINYFVSRNCSVNISDFRDGQRHDMWLPLQNIKTGRLRLAVTVLGDAVKVNFLLCSNRQVIND